MNFQAKILVVDDNKVNVELIRAQLKAFPYEVIAYNDAKAEVWFAPAGLQRGRIPNTLGSTTMSVHQGDPVRWTTW